MPEENSFELLDTLERRIDKVSEKVIGQCEIAENPEDIVTSNVISTLALLGSKIGNALSTRDRMMMVMKRLDELERYLSPTYGDSSIVSDDVKANLILAQEDSLRLQYERLNLLMEKKQVLDSSHITDSLKLNDSLLEARKKHCKLDQESDDQNKDIIHLLDNYNSILSALNENFLKMASLIAKAESEKI